MKTIISFFLLLICYCSYGQAVVNTDNISIVTNKQISFAFTDANDLITDKSISDAFEIKLNSQSNNTSVFAKLVYIGQPLQKSLSLKLNHKTSTNSSDNGAQEIVLGPQSQLLFAQPQIKSTISYFYDLVLHPSTTFINPGNYNFSIIFTMTQP